MKTTVPTEAGSGSVQASTHPQRGGRPVTLAPFVLLPLVVLVMVPALLLSQSLEDLATFHPASFLLMAATAALVALVLVALQKVEERLTSKRFYAIVVEFVFFFVIVTGFVLPASVSAAMQDPGIANVNVPHVLAASAIGFLMLILAGTRMRGLLYAGIGVFLVVIGLSTFPTLSPMWERPRDAADGEPGILSLSSDRNILVMSFDGLPGPAVTQALEGDPELRERFDGFTFFRGAASSSPATSASTATSLYGNRDYKSTHFQTTEDLWRSDPDRLITNTLEGHGWIVSTYGEYGREFVEPSRAFAALADRPPGSVLRLVNYSLARTLTRVSVIPGSASDVLDDAYATVLADISGQPGDPSKRFVATHVPEWKRIPLTPTALDFDAYLQGLSVGSEDPVAHFLHFTHTHYPVEWDRECRWASRDWDWYATHQDWQGVVDQTHCALTQMADYLGVLKSLGVYDQSLIVLKSDHGEPVMYNDPRRIESFSIRGHPMQGYGRFAPFLAVKDFGPNAGSISVDGHPVLLDDLARTICDSSQIAVDCTGYGAIDLLGGDWDGIEDELVTLYLVTGPDSSHEYDTHAPLTLRRGERILSSLHDALSDELIRSPVACGQTLDVTGGVPHDNGRSDLHSWLTWQDMGSSFVRFGLLAPCSDVTLLIGDQGSDIDRDELTVLVDDEPIPATVDEAQPRAGSAGGPVSVTIPGDAIAADEPIEIEVRPVDGDTTGSIPIRAVVLSEERTASVIAR